MSTTEKHILVVDDDKFAAQMAATVLDKFYKVTQVYGGEEAIMFLSANRVDLILLDILMPHMDGFATLKAIKELDEKAGGETPVVFVTADNDVKQESEAIKAGAMDFIIKPFAAQVLHSRVSRILELMDYRRALEIRLEKKSEEARAYKQKSIEDQLTGLWNRGHAEECVETMLAESKCGAFFMFDLDNFKAVNDIHGHSAGDEALKMLAQVLLRYSRDEDMVARLGGDEFVLFISGEVSRDKLKDRAEIILEAMRQRIADHEYDMPVSASIGISMAPEDGTTFTELYEAADKALYHVKENGKNGYHFYSRQHSEDAGRTVDLSYLRSFMIRKDMGAGAFMLDLDSFSSVYNFLCRYMARGKRLIQTVLFTVNKRHEGDETEVMEIAMDGLEAAVRTSLRASDIFTAYSGRQMIVMLMDTSTQNAHHVVERVLDCFEAMPNANDIEITYEIVEVEDK